VTFVEKNKQWKKITDNLNQFGESGGNPLENGSTLLGWATKLQFAFTITHYQFISIL